MLKVIFTETHTHVVIIFCSCRLYRVVFVRITTVKGLGGLIVMHMNNIANDY